MNKHPNQHLGRTVNTEPTLTDQSQAQATDINIIVTQFLRTGHAPQARQGQYGDFTQLPTDLRGFIEMGRSISKHQNELPEQLREIPIEYLVRMTNEQINDILRPPEEPAEVKKDNPT